MTYNNNFMEQVIATTELSKPDFKSVMRDYFDLSKPGIGFYSLITTFTAFWLASNGSIDLILLLHTIIATGLVTAGGGALNQVIEINIDSQKCIVLKNVRFRQEEFRLHPVYHSEWLLPLSVRHIYWLQ